MYNNVDLISENYEYKSNRKTANPSILTTPLWWFDVSFQLIFTQLFLKIEPQESKIAEQENSLT